MVHLFLLIDHKGSFEGCTLKRRGAKYLVNWMLTNQWRRGDEEDRNSLICNKRVSYTHEGVYFQRTYLVIHVFL